jgi:uncharacterized protein YhaN
LRVLLSARAELGLRQETLRAQATTHPDLAEKRRSAELLVLELEERATKLTREHEGKRSGLLQMLQPRDNAAESLAEAHAHLAVARVHARSYAKKRIAIGLLVEEMRRYQQKNEVPILTEASTLFARLTLGRFARVAFDYGHAGEPHLVCVRDDGANLSVEALSEGTRDQLYAALQFAAIRTAKMDQAHPPLLLDDTFVHFDDARTAAALAMLVESGVDTLYFTHHENVLALARQTPGVDAVVL